jgi:hypothetical protein
MVSNLNKVNSRNIERGFLLVITIVMALLFFKLFTVLQKDFAEVPERLKNGTIMNLNDKNPGDRIRVLLQKGFYLSDQRDINLISTTVTNGTSAADVIDNIGELNKKRYNVNAEQAYRQGGETFKKRVAVERSLIGFSDADSSLFAQESRKPMKVLPTNDLSMGKHRISGEILKAEGIPASRSWSGYN